MVAAQLPKREERKDDSGPHRSLPFLGSTEYRDMHFGDVPIDGDDGDLAGYRRPAAESAPFDGTSEARTAFVQHPMEPGKKAVKARSHGIGVGEGAFKGDTESREAFPGHKVRRVHVVECGERPPWLPSWAMLMLLSLLPGVWCAVQPPPAVARAPLTWEPNDLQFMGKTTTGETYVGGPVEPRKPYQPPTRTKMRCVLRVIAVGV